MTTERQACGFGSLLPMSCRGRAEAFARRLQSRLQSLGRAGSGDGASSPDDETSWLTRQQEVTHNQPRLSSSSDSDIYLDFDLDCESPGSPVEDTTYSDTLPEYLVNKSRSLHCPPKAQYSSESGCVSSPSAVTGTSPGSDTSDGPYFDSVNPDTEATTTENRLRHETSPEVDSVETNTHNLDLNADDGVHGKLNGYTFDSWDPIEESKRPVRRNFRNAAGFRISNAENNQKASTDFSENSDVADVSTVSLKDITAASSENSTTEDYFECPSLKTEDTLSEGLSSINLQDSGYPNTAESSRCNSQNDTPSPQIETTETPCEEINSVEIFNISSQTIEWCSDLPSYTDETPLTLHADEENLTDLISYDSIRESISISVDPVDSELQLNTSDNICLDSEPERQENLKAETVSLSLNLETGSVSTTESWISPEKGKRNEVDDDDDSRGSTPRVRRCSSLKTGKTPPGTPGRKKIVRFADVLGLDLADIRTFLDEIPKVPKSAYEDLKCVDLSDVTTTTSLTDGTLKDVLSTTCISGIPRPDRCLMPLFQQPGGETDFMDRVREEKVCLENALLTDTVSYTISGTVRVRNLDFHKSVHIRYSLDGWKTFADLQATYVPNSCDGFSDTFTFKIYGHTLQIGQRLEFAVRFQCKGTQYWDSNRGANYVFQCLPPADPSRAYQPLPISPDGPFSTSFY